jgi:hypothetical protein
MDSIRASEAPDAGSIPAEATFSHKLIIAKKTKNLPDAVLKAFLFLDAFLLGSISFNRE